MKHYARVVDGLLGRDGDGRRAGASGVRARDGTDSERDTTEIHRGAGGGYGV